MLKFASQGVPLVDPRRGVCLIAVCDLMGQRTCKLLQAEGIGLHAGDELSTEHDTVAQGSKERCCRGSRSFQV